MIPGIAGSNPAEVVNVIYLRSLCVVLLWAIAPHEIIVLYSRKYVVGWMKNALVSHFYFIRKRCLKFPNNHFRSQVTRENSVY